MTKAHQTHRSARTVKQVPLERDEMRILAQWLDIHRLLWLHPFNEGCRTPYIGRYLKTLGLKSGVADVLIFDAPPARLECRGVAIELKRISGGRVSPAQQEWLESIRKRGWIAMVCAGVDDAVRQLKLLGYGDIIR